MGRSGNRLENFLRPRPKEGSVKGTLLWRPAGGVELYVHSLMSDPYGADDTEGLDEALSPENIQVARACRQVEVKIEQGEMGRDEGLRLIGSLMLRVVEPGKLSPEE